MSNATWHSLNKNRRLGQIVIGMLTAFLIMACGSTVPTPSPELQTRESLLWVEQTKLLSSDKKTGDFFGNAVALSRDGNTALVGADWHSVSGMNLEGAAYVYIRTGTGWTQQQKLLADDRPANGNFGRAVALSADGNTALIGTSGVAVYVYVRSGSIWTQQQKLLASDKSNGDNFGGAVALSADGNVALVGASLHNDTGTTSNGAAYVYMRSGSVWTQQQKLLASDKENGDVLGTSVALSANGNTALIGALGESDSGTTQNGAAYVFVRSGSAWTQQWKLLAGDKASGDWFSWSIALSGDGDTALIGAQAHDDSGANDNGAAYVYVRIGSIWVQQQKILASDKASGNLFGSSVRLAADGNTALLGASGRNDSGLVGNGAAYAFVRSGSAWTQQQKFLASDKASGDHFGSSVALSADGYIALIGAPREDDSGTTDNGSAYTFALPKGIGSSCAGGDDCASGFCVDEVCCNSACGGSIMSDCQACKATLKASGSGDGICGPALATVVCRKRVDVCDLPETCTGDSIACPADSFAPATTVCRSASGACDVSENCSGTSSACPADSLSPTTLVCRPSTGPKDQAESCTGFSSECPPDSRDSGGSCSVSHPANRTAQTTYSLLFTLAILALLRRRKRITQTS